MIESLVLYSDHCFDFKTMQILLLVQIFGSAYHSFLFEWHLILTHCNSDLNHHMRRRLYSWI
jgi:hypothetical protein